jgi:uncharacterized hydantoinase/oxoprolinase family protein
VVGEAAEVAHVAKKVVQALVEVLDEVVQRRRRADNLVEVVLLKEVGAETGPGEVVGSIELRLAASLDRPS